jgi:hypothetical protein
MKKFGPIAVIVVLLMTLFMPMVAVHLYSVSIDISKEAPGEVTVGLVVILRATFRRLLRGLSVNIMQTTVGTFGRTSARTITRRFVKFVGRVLFGSILQDSVGDAKVKSIKNSKKTHPSFLKQLFSLALGFVGLCLSFWGILHVISPDKMETLVGSKGLSELEAVVLAGMPLLAYALLHWVFGRKFGVRTVYCTEIDGLILQGYFTGAGSFLPMTTDIEYYGKKEAHCKLAVCALLGMFALFGLFYVAGEWLNIGSFNFLSSMFLIYSFVYCFPIEPLEGHLIWSRSKLLWAAVTIPILLAFMNCMDSTFGDIL